MLGRLRRLTVVLGIARVLASSSSLAATSTSPSSPPVNVRLRAPWQTSPLLLEILEAVHTEDPTAFYPLLAELTTNEAHRASLAGASGREVLHTVQQVLDSLGLLADIGSRQNWELSLALHTESAKIAAFWQLAQTSGIEERWTSRVGNDTGSASACGSWVDWYGQVICAVDELDGALATDSRNISPFHEVSTYPFDHIVLPTATADTAVPTAVLYGDPVSDNFANLHNWLYSHARDQGRLKYVLRWKPSHVNVSGDAAALTSGYLTGYGATLDLKKVDYLVIDDRKLKHASGAPSLGDAAGSPGLEQQLEARQWLDEQLLLSSTYISNHTALSAEEIESLGVTAAQVVLSSPDPIKALQQLSQDFPLHSKNLARGGVHTSEDLEEELSYMTTRIFRPGAMDLYLNGRPVTETEVSPQVLVKLLRSERRLINSLMSGPLQLTAQEATTILSNQTTGKAQSPAVERQNCFDASDRIERLHLLQRAKAEDDNSTQVIDDVQYGPITWWNDVEHDPEFRMFSPSLKTLLRQMMPGQFPQIRRNAFNVIWIFDLRSTRASQFLTQQICPLIGTARIPLHWGLVPGGLEEGPTSDATRIARLYWHVFDHHGRTGACRFLEALGGPPKPPKRSRRGQYDDEEEGDVEEDVYVTLKDAQAAFIAVKKELNVEHQETQPQDLSSAPHPREEPVKEYVRRLRVTTAEDSDGHMFFNGQYYPFIGPNIFQLIMQLVSVQTQLLQRPLYHGELQDDIDISNYFYDQPGTFTGRSELVFPSARQDAEYKVPQARAIDLVKSRELATDEALTFIQEFLYPSEDTRVNTTAWIVGDLDDPSSQKVVHDAVRLLSRTSSFRLGFLHTTSDKIHQKEAGLSLSAFLGHLVKAQMLGKMSPHQFVAVMKELRPTSSNLDRAGRVYSDVEESTVTLSESDSATAAAAALVNDVKAQSWNVTAAQEGGGFWAEAGIAAAQIFGVASGEPALVVNGRVITDLNFDKIGPDDLEALLQNERFKRIDPVVASLPPGVGHKLAQLNRDDAANAVADIASVLSLYYYNDETKRNMFAPPVTMRVNNFDHIPAKYSTFEIGNKTTARLRFQAIVDPLAERTQRWSSLFRLLSSMDDVHLQVIMNPQQSLKEVPLKRFYRYSAPAKLSFDENGQETAPTLSFYGLPQDAVLTMGVDAPAPWLTMASEAVYDLDNILLREVPEDGREAGVLAVYDLRQILIEGHAREVTTNAIPRGLQLLLQTPDGSQTLDTIVTANLAYFQFRARPGLYKLSIRPGRGDELYEMKSVGNLGWDSPEIEITGDAITLDSLQGLTIYPTVKKRRGREKEDLIERVQGEAEVVTGLTRPFAAAKSMFNSFKQAASSATAFSSTTTKGANQADLNIFTVASGHLYERMTYIMILSVLRHTKSSVKFWFIENFLSPSFKDFIPHLAKEYGFQYEMVTYAWPHWLRAQKEKQRTIWGYKILFLDVLFPLDLDKVIFVDSDQVVRTDLKELTEIDLKGAPYGFPPMGNDSYDMDGYRFWKQGYWKDFLRGRPYHISALYVVDLQRFRSITAGDILREQYHALSADPNSLSNLDQDLPQVLMDHIPIHTLDQEWLWCETWCSTDWLHKAKTIDLCSNPKTHEAKLDRARRQIPEWTELDEEVQRLARRVGGGGSGSQKEGIVVVEEKTEDELSAEADQHLRDEL